MMAAMKKRQYERDIKKADPTRWTCWAGGLRQGPQGAYEVSFPGKGIYIFLQRPSDRDTISCPVWRSLTWAWTEM